MKKTKKLTNMTLEAQIKEILQNKFTGSEHIGEVYFTEATHEILAVIAKRDDEAITEEITEYVSDPNCYAAGYDTGFNDCRAEIKAFLEASRKEKGTL